MTATWCFYIDSYVSCLGSAAVQRAMQIYLQNFEPHHARGILHCTYDFDTRRTRVFFSRQVSLVFAAFWFERGEKIDPII